MPILVDNLLDNQALKAAGLGVWSSDLEILSKLSCGLEFAQKHYEVTRNQIGVTLKVKAPFYHGQIVPHPRNEVSNA